MMKHIIKYCLGLVALVMANDLPVIALIEVRGHNITGAELKRSEQVARLELQQSQLFRLLTYEETIERAQAAGEDSPPQCFTNRCRRQVARDLNCQVIAAISLEMQDRRYQVKAELFDGSTGASIESIRYSAPVINDQTLVHLVQHSLKSLLGLPVEDSLFASRDTLTVGQRPSHWLAGAAILGGGFALAGIKNGGLFLTEDSNPLDSGFTSTDSHHKTLSGIRGFFGSKAPLARQRGLAGAGIAMTSELGSDIPNPAGLCGLPSQELTFSTSTLPAGSGDQFFAQWAAPLIQGIWWSQGIRFEGDEMASELAFQSSMAFDLSYFSNWLTGIQTALSVKGYSVQVGQSGEGIAYSTGNGLGSGFDLAMQWKLSAHARFGLLIEDLWSNIWYHNTLTGGRYSESVPTLLTFGTQWTSPIETRLYLDWRKGLLLGQRDRLMLGFEHPLWQMIWMRGGLSQMMGTDIRMWSLGASVHAKHENLGLRLHYAWESGVEPYNALSSNQVVSIAIEF